MEFMEVVRERYSCKDYDSSRQVEKEKLERYLQPVVMFNPVPFDNVEDEFIVPAV